MGDYKKGGGGGSTSGGTGMTTAERKAHRASRARVAAARAYVKNNPPTWSDTHMPTTGKTQPQVTTTPAPSVTSTTTSATTRRNRTRQRNRGGGGGNDNSDLYKEAQRQFKLMIQPYLDAIKRAKQKAKNETDQYITRAGNIGEGLDSSLAALDAPLQSSIAGIGNTLTSQTSALAPLMNQDIGAAPADEAAAASNLLATNATGGLNQLAQIGSTGAAYNQSARRQGAEEVAIGSRNALGDLKNTRTDLNQQIIDLKSQAPAQIKQILSDLTQRDLNNFLARGQLAVSRGNLGVAQAGLGLEEDAQNASNSLYNALFGYINNYLNSGGDLADIAGLFGGVG